MRKTMRKSALLSSVAMLIVSAIVLTSATYAWFASSDRVDVKSIKATVETSSGLLISIDKGISWKTSVDVTDQKPSTFSPVSTATGKAGTWVTGGYKNDVLELKAATAGTTGQYMAYEVWVKGPVGETVTVTPNFIESGAEVKKAMKFALYDITDSDATKHSFIGNGTKTGVIAADGTTTGYQGTSATGNQTGVNTENGAFTIGGTSITEVDKYTFTLGAAPSKFMAYVWVEGNDVDCNGEKISGQKVEFAVNMTLPTYEGDKTTVVDPS